MLIQSVRAKLRLMPNLAGLFLALGLIILVGVAGGTLYDLTVWGKDIGLIFFGSRTDNAIGLGIGMRVVHYFLIGLALLLSGFLTFRARAQDGMRVKSEGKLKKLQNEKIEEKYERILSALNEKERDLEKSIDEIVEKLAVRRFREKIRAKQSVINQLAAKKNKLERKLNEMGNRLMLEEGGQQTDEKNKLPILERARQELEKIKKIKEY